MLRKSTFVGIGVALVLLAGPSFAATVKVTDGGLEPETVTVKKGEEVVWVDATTDRAAHVALDFARGAGAKITMTKGGDLRATFEKPGSYDYAAHVGLAGEAHPHEIRGKIIVK